MAVVVYVPSRLGEGFFTDLPAPTAGDDAKAITYDHDTGAFVYAAASATPGGSTTQVQYNNAGAFAGHSGMAYDDVNSRLTVTGGLVAPSMRPASDSTTALQLQNASGTAVATVDTTNSRVGIGGTPSYKFSVVGTTTSAADPVFYVRNDYSAVFIGTFNLETPNITAGQSAYFNLGKNNSNYNRSAVIFKYAGDGSTSNALTFGFSGAADLLTILANGAVGIANTSPSALLDLAASTTTRSSSRQRAGTAPTSPNDGDMWNDGNAYAVCVNGTNAVNTDGGLSIWMQSSTTARNVGRLLWQYTDKTDATRVTKGALTAYYQSTERKAIHWSADSAGPLLSFGPVTTPIATPVLATGASATPDDIITVLQNLGLVKQS